MLVMIVIIIVKCCKISSDASTETSTKDLMSMFCCSALACTANCPENSFAWNRCLGTENEVCSG